MMRDIVSTHRRGFVHAAVAVSAVFIAASTSMAGAASMNTGQRASHVGISATDRQFADDAAQGGAMEVILGKIAQQYSTNRDIKEFGKRMAVDHTRANKQLDRTAHSIGLSIDWQPSYADRQTLAKLAQLHGAAFDRAYSADMVKDHEKTIALFEREAKDGRNSQLRQFAQQTLPILRSHLSMADAMAEGKPSMFAHRLTREKALAKQEKPMSKTSISSSSAPANTAAPNTVTPPTGNSTTPPANKAGSSSVRQ